MIGGIVDHHCLIFLFTINGLKFNWFEKLHFSLKTYVFVLLINIKYW